MPETLFVMPAATEKQPVDRRGRSCRVAVLWIDWYAYHVARFRGLESAPTLSGRVVGLEMVGGIGVHAGLKFREELPAGLKVESILPHGNWKTASKWTLAREVWRRLNRVDPEVVLVPGYYTLPSLAAAAWGRVHGRTSVLMTESTAIDHVRRGWKERLKSWLIRGFFDWAVTGGTAHVDYLRQLGFPAERIVGFYDVVDNDFFRLGTKQLRRSGGAASGLPSHYFLYVGRLAEEKNVRGLVTSWLQYRANGGTWSLLLAGDGPEAERLRAQVAATGQSDSVCFAGHKNSEELLPLYAFAKCLVLPSTREPWGLVVNEAMASRLPVLVSSRCGCAEDLVTSSENGFVFDPDADGELARLLTRMESMEAGLRLAMGECSLATIERYSPQNFGRSIAAIVDAADSARRSGR